MLQSVNSSPEKATDLNKLQWFLKVHCQVKPGCNYTTMNSFAPHVTPVWTLVHRIHLCVLCELFSQLLPNSPWSQFQFAAPTCTWLAIGNLISNVSPMWGGWVQSWNNRWVKQEGKKHSRKQTKVAFLCGENIHGQYSLTTLRASLRKSSFSHVLCLNVSEDCWWRTNSGKSVSAERKTALCRRWWAVWFMSWDCNENGGLMNLPEGVWGGTIPLRPPQWNVCLTAHHSYHGLFFLLSH